MIIHFLKKMIFIFVHQVHLKMIMMMKMKKIIKILKNQNRNQKLKKIIHFKNFIKRKIKYMKIC